MFRNLVESGSHAVDVRRKSSFILLTIAGYTALILASFVASVYAYDARLEQDNLEALAQIESPSISFIEPEESRSVAAPSSTVKSVMTNELSSRADAIAPPSRPDLVPDSVSTAANPHASLPNIGVILNGRDRDGNPPVGIPGSNRNPFAGATEGTSVKAATPPPLPPVITKKAEPVAKPSKPPVVSKGVVNGLATYKPEPPYPQVAKNARVSGIVQIQILIDEQGKVIHAQALSGHALLRNAALNAARQAKFTPTKLSDVPVKVQGVITYNFKLG